MTSIENRITSLENKPTSNIDAYTKTECDSKYLPKSTLNNNINMFNNSFSIFTQIYDDSTSTGLKVNFRLCDKSYIQFNNSGVWINNLHTLNSTTITHYAPIENDESFELGSPCFMSGKVYNRNDNKWIPSTAADRTDCICSVVNSGNHKSFVGVVVSIDEQNKSLTYASHGDFMFNVEDTSLYEVGDVVLYDGRILEDDLTITSALLQSVVGKITAIIDEHTLAIFKD